MSEMTYHDQLNVNVLGIYGGLVAGSFMMAGFGIIIHFIALLRSSEKLHDKMTVAVLKAPVLFFDTNPVGRIMNRFSKDIGTMDDLLPNSFSLSVGSLLYFLAVLGLSVIVNYWLLIPVIIVITGFYLLLHFYLKPARDVSRLEAISCSPVYAHVSEIMEGLEVIHSLGMEEKSVEKLYK